MGKTLIGWAKAAAALTVVLSIASGAGPAVAHPPPPCPPPAAERAPPPRAGVYGYDYRSRRRRLERIRSDRDQDIQRERYEAHERFEAHERWLRRHRRLVRHWHVRDHHLAFEHPEAGRRVHRHAVLARRQPALRQTQPSAPARLARLVRPHQAPLALQPAPTPVLLPKTKLKPLGRTLALPVIQSPTSPELAGGPGAPTGAAASGLQSQLARLTAAVAEDMKGARLDVPPNLSLGSPGKVTLTLPADLLQTMRADAAGVALGPAARRVFVTVRLSGQGYSISPIGEQSARLGREPAAFVWDVAPSSAPGGVLTADMTASLQGEGEAKTFALGAVTAQIPLAPRTVAAAAPAAAPSVEFRLPDLSRLNLRQLAIPGHPSVRIPGFGLVPSYKVVAAGIAGLVLVLLMWIARSAGARRERAERRRRFHAFDATDFRDERY